ncbi:hypothetical protein BJY04DRAFT_200071 [Aspergillus karnatakaensis]|uniref:uncharacterized protein n=1 Tax=Aspergillus karnatakaensis TaxID=1810916 RepID=UPI003CCCE9B4
MTDILNSDKIRPQISSVRAAAVIGQASWFRKLLSKIDYHTARKEYGSIFMSAVEGGDINIIQHCLSTHGVWHGVDTHGWCARLMIDHKHDDKVTDIFRPHAVPLISSARGPSSWEVHHSDAPGILMERTVLCLDGYKDTHQMVNGNHPFVPHGSSYFEVEFLELQPFQGTADAVCIGATDEFQNYFPARYSNTGYVYDLFSQCQARCFRAGDTVGYGIDWRRQEHFFTYNGERKDVDMCFEHLYERRLFPLICLYAGAGSCRIKANFQGPFLYPHSG